MATAAIKQRAEVACKLCRSVAVKTKGQKLIAKRYEFSSNSRTPECGQKYAV